MTLAIDRSSSEVDSTLGAVARALIRLAWPAVMTSLLQTAVFLADRLLLGRLSQDALASMQVQGPLLWSLYSVTGGVLVGAIPLVARSIGAGDRERAEAATRAAFSLAFFLGLAVAVGTGLLRDPIVRALGPPSESLRALSSRYIGVAVFGTPQLFVATIAAMILGAAGNTRTPFLVGLLTNAVNVVANVLLIFGADLGPLGHVPRLGVAGSALGSVIAFTLESALLCYAITRPSSPVRLRNPFRSGAADKAARRALLGLSSPAVLERIVIHAGYLAYSGIITRLGAVVMASNQALITLESICFLSADGFGIAAAALVGQSLGRRAPEAARRAGWLASGLAAALLVTAGITIWAAGPELLRLFVPSGRSGGDLIESGMSALPLLALSQPFLALAVVLSQSLRGAGDTLSPLAAAVAGGAFVRVGAVWWLGLHAGLGLRAVWLASLADWIVRTLLLASVFARGRWRLIRF